MRVHKINNQANSVSVFCGNRKIYMSMPMITGIREPIRHSFNELTKRPKFESETIMQSIELIENSRKPYRFKTWFDDKYRNLAESLGIQKQVTR